MTRRNEASLASLLLTNRLTETGAKPLAAGEFWAFVERIGDLAGVLGLDAGSIADAGGVAPAEAERIATLMQASTMLAFELERLEHQGTSVLSPFDDGYPERIRERLGAAAPPTLVAVGPIELLEQGGIGIVGSRDVSPAGVDVARQVAEIAVERGLPVISGGARGVDQQSMAAAYQAGGKVVGVLAESLERRIRDPETRRVIGEGAACLVTPYKPDAGFSVANAMGRNKIVYALAQVTLVVASDEGRGGTWEGALEALHRRYGAVAVWTGEGAGPGNGALVARGAISVTTVEERSWLEARADERSSPPEQLRLA